MFRKDNWYNQPRVLLNRRLEITADSTDYDHDFLRHMVEVEYGLRLLEKLGLYEEPIITLPALLTLHALPGLNHFTEVQSQLLAFARISIPHYVSNQRWRDDLREYAQLPQESKLYAVNDEMPFEDQLLQDMIHDSEFAQHFEVYDAIIESRPPYSRKKSQLADPAQRYHFYAYFNKKRPRTPVSVELPKNLQVSQPHWMNLITNINDNNEFESYVETLQKEVREPIDIEWQTLIDEAHLMECKDSKRNWAKRIDDMNLLTTREDDAFHLNGQMHLVGMVGAGKSTLIKIITHHLMRTTSKTVVIIVPATIDAFKFANEMNHLLKCDWDSPLAVAYFGWSNRDKHIQTFLNEYGDDPEDFGHRWASTSCALMSLISPDVIAEMPSPPRPGTEPCETLSDTPLQPIPDSSDKFERPKRDKTCPFYDACPSHQKLRDLAQARIIVTTAGALQSRLPAFVDPRRLHLADYIYEQADIVFVDEADEVQAFEDDQFVNMVPLWNQPKALFSGADSSVSESLRYEFLNELQENWVFSHRDGPKYILNLLRMLHKTGNRHLLSWIGRSYFSAYRLFQTVARRMIGLPDWISTSEMSPIEKRRYDYLSTIFSMLTAIDFTKIPDPDYTSPEQLKPYGSEVQVRYAVKLRDILSRATSNVPRDLESDLLNLVCRMLDEIDVDIEDSLHNLNTKLADTSENESKPSGQPEETPKSLSHKLMFCLLAAGLDREIKLLVYNADSQPDLVASVLDIRDFNPNFRTAHTALPVAYTGSIFGTYYTPDERQPEQSQGDRGQNEALARLEYVNPGRELLLRFHELYKLFGIFGPHVVFLSGTSYLPHSTRWHIRTEIDTVLEANPEWRDTIKDQSEYHFSPAYDADNSPIRVSGADSTTHDYSRAKEDALREIARYWAKKNTLESQLRGLEDRGKAQEFWADRARILIFVNSYEQASILGKAIRQYTKDFDDEHVQWLKPSDDENSYDGIARASIERIAQTNIKVLIAPLAAIGRGHNILTQDAKRAAFGAVYFVVRPLNPPGDVNGIAAEINAKGETWLSEPHPAIASQERIYKQEIELRRLALEQWHRGERRTYYNRLDQSERSDLGATTLGRFIQASGRLVRGGVPMIVHFVDTAWAPVSAERIVKKHRRKDTRCTSLLVEMICLLKEYTRSDDPVGNILYQPFLGLTNIKGLYYQETDCNEQQ